MEIYSEVCLIVLNVVEIVGFNLQVGVDQPLLSQLARPHHRIEVVSDLSLIGRELELCDVSVWVQKAGHILLPSRLTVWKHERIHHGIEMRTVGV